MFVLHLSVSISSACTDNHIVIMLMFASSPDQGFRTVVGPKVHNFGCTFSVTVLRWITFRGQISQRKLRKCMQIRLK